VLLVLCEEITNKNDIASKHLIAAQKVAVSLLMIGLLNIAQQHHPNIKTHSPEIGISNLSSKTLLIRFYIEA
jgi:hypothetical protein